MTSSNGNIFRVAGHLCGEFTGHPHKRQWRGALMFSLICAWINSWANNRESGDLRFHRAHYDVIVVNAGFVVIYMKSIFAEKMSSYQYRDSHYEDKTVWLPSYLHNGNTRTRKDSLYIETGPRDVTLSACITQWPWMKNMTSHKRLVLWCYYHPGNFITMTS